VGKLLREVRGQGSNAEGINASDLCSFRLKVSRTLAERDKINKVNIN
jgi:hypothetical protein